MRTNVGLSQIDLAYRSGVSRFRLFLIEKGYQKPKHDEAEKLKIFFRSYQESKRVIK